MTSIDRPALPRNLIWLMAATAVLFLMLLGLNQPLQTPVAPQGLISFELAGTADNARAISASWGQPGKVWAIASLGLGMVFILVYLATLLMLTTHLLQDRPGVRERKVGRWVKSLFLAAGMADAADHVVLLANLDSPTDYLSLVATVLTLMKYTGLLVGVAGLVVIRAARRHPMSWSPHSQ